MSKTINMNNPQPIKQRAYLYEATSDAEWSPTNSRWELTAKRYKQDGTLGDYDAPKVAIGIEDDHVPILEGDTCIEIITDEGFRVLRPVAGAAGASRLWEAVSDSTFDSGTGLWSVTARRVFPDGTIDADEPETPDTLTAVRPYRNSARLTSTVFALLPLYSGDRAIEVRMADGTTALLKVGETMPMTFDAKIIGDAVFYFVDDDANQDSYAVSINGTRVSREVGGGWNAGTTYQTGVYYLAIRKGGPNEDYTIAGNAFWRVLHSTELAGLPAINIYTVPLFQIDTTTKEVKQIRRGHINFNISEPDKDVLANPIYTALEPKDQPRSRSLERDGGVGQLQLFDFNESTPTAPDMARTVNFLVQERAVGAAEVNELRYLSKQGMADFINANVTLPSPPPDYDPEAPTVWDNWWASQPHSRLADVQDQTVGDDHRGGRDAATGIDGKHPYLHANGDATRNAMPGVIGDASGDLSVSPNAKTLSSGAGENNDVRINWDDCKMYDKNGVLAIDWHARKMYGTDGALVFDFSGEEP